jgi:hypothetical protein
MFVGLSKDKVMTGCALTDSGPSVRRPSDVGACLRTTPRLSFVLISVSQHSECRGSTGVSTFIPAKTRLYGISPRLFVIRLRVSYCLVIF